MSEIEKIKELAKETLEKKWYPIRDGQDIDRYGSCSFCIDAGERREPFGYSCEICYLVKWNGKELIKSICDDIDNENDKVIKKLEQLVKTGVLK